MRVLSLFSGVGGFDMGLEAAGMVTVFQCEIDKHATSVLDHHWPNVPKWGDITTLTGAHILEATGGVDVVAWGSPCQDLSVAGKRAGLAGQKSGLFYQGIRIIKELRELTNGKSPTWSIWENVAGALSSNRGADFGQVLYEMAEAGAFFSEWALLDAQYFGIPQRRKRVFLTTCFDLATSQRCSNPLLPVSESLPGDTKKGRQKGQNTSSTARDCTRTDSDDGEWWNGKTIADTVTRTSNESPIPDKNKFQVVLQNLKNKPIAFSHTQGLDCQPSETHFPTLRREGNGHAVMESTLVVRRLTPLECERLMGWPDNHTAVGVNGAVSDSQRYKMCGNGVASPVAAWIAKQIMNMKEEQ